MWQFYIYVGIYSPRTTNSSDAPAEMVVVKCNLFLLNLNEKTNDSSTELITKHHTVSEWNIIYSLINNREGKAAVEIL